MSRGRHTTVIQASQSYGIETGKQAKRLFRLNDPNDAMPFRFSLIQNFKSKLLPRFKRVAIWLVVSTGIAGAAKFTANLEVDSVGTQAAISDQSVHEKWDTAESWWDPDVNLDELTERYTGERPFRLLSLGGYNLQTTALQPSAPHQPFSNEVGPTPTLDLEPPSETSAPFRNTPVELADISEISGSAEYVPPDGIVVGGEISGFLGDVVYLSSGESNYIGQFSAVPEPTSAALLLLSALGLASSRRRGVQRASSNQLTTL